MEAAEAQPHVGTARDNVAADVPRASPDARAGDVRTSLAGRRFTSATELAVLEGERLVGVVAIEALLGAEATTPVGALAAMPAVVLPDQELEAAIRRSAHAGVRSIAVVDEHGRFHGLVPLQRLLLVLEHEHEEDLARLGGFLSQASAARATSEESVLRRLWHRLPWLAIGLLGAMSSALIVGAFEEELRKEVLLAFFVPAVVYMADAVGTQTEALVIRGMALGIPVRKVFARELATGLVIGALLALAFFSFALLAWGDASVAAAVGISLAVSCSVATVVAMALPYVLDRLGRDPAYGAGPLATVVQDLLSIVAYFAVALLLVT